MKITLSDTDIFTPNLKEQFLRELKPRLGELDLEKTYTLTLFFDEYCLLDREQMDAFVIPREALPRYLQDREMTGEEKRSQLLSYQLGEAAACLGELGIRSWLFNITGIVMADSPRLILTLEEGKPFSEETSSGRRRRKGTDTVPRVFSIMPSMRGFEKNLAGLAERWTDELVQAFGSKKLYEQYEKILGWGKLREILTRFRQEYGRGFFGLPEEKRKLQAEFLRMVKEAAEEKSGAGPEAGDGGRAAAAGGEKAADGGEKAAGSGEKAADGGEKTADGGRAAAAGVGNDGREKGTAKTGTPAVGQTSEKREKRVTICRMPVSARTKTGRKSRRQAGWVLLETDGRGLWLTWEKKTPGETAVTLPEGYGDADGRGDLEGRGALEGSGNIGETAKSSQAILAEIRRLTGQAKEMLTGQGYVLETDPVDQILAFTDLKEMMKKIRRDLLLK